MIIHVTNDSVGYFDDNTEIESFFDINKKEV